VRVTRAAQRSSCHAAMRICDHVDARVTRRRGAELARHTRRRGCAHAVLGEARLPLGWERRSVAEGDDLCTCFIEKPAEHIERRRARRWNKPPDPESDRGVDSRVRRRGRFSRTGRDSCRGPGISFCDGRRTHARAPRRSVRRFRGPAPSEVGLGRARAGAVRRGGRGGGGRGRWRHGR
jgi:hypothetical protein